VIIPPERDISDAERQHWLDLGYADDPDDWPYVTDGGYYTPRGHELAELESAHPYDADDPDGAHSSWSCRLPKHLARDHWRIRVLVALTIRRREQRAPARIVYLPRHGRARASRTRRARLARARRASSGSSHGSSGDEPPGRRRDLARKGDLVRPHGALHVPGRADRRAGPRAELVHGEEGAGVA
jgi:hypothetical protein